MYKKLMFPEPSFTPQGFPIPKPKFTMSEIDSMDFGFFDEMFSEEQPEQKVYIDQVWA
ncbi:hypothetical protein [Oceanobacillus profundus]|uniref:hypothetical protein n=1 Tax=Oceanobacillus profundus TaxID=372463 RepID=UPI0026E46F6B|nr:hypothetical protein [Oceanobacillus profundus]